MKDWGESKDLDKDAKERSKERKKTVEENKGKTDKKAQAMNALKARREEKKERGTLSLLARCSGCPCLKLVFVVSFRGKREAADGGTQG